MEHRGPYKMRTIARLTHFSPALLRAWERRHNLLEPLRGPGGHRLYTEEDLQVLLRVRELIGHGRSIGEIARVGREALLRQGADRFQDPASEAPAAAPPLAPEALGALHADCNQIVEAALKMDSGAINRTLDQSFARVSPEAVIFEVIAPATRQIGDLWAQSKCSVASEHMASGI
ncbi:MAG: MerR family transcriptional regulator, partial [Acidobacteria bacterium]|nr:MerR family transcriptional regulator [Acidobacteriota bacterium]